jgi:hypothetical protein
MQLPQEKKTEREVELECGYLLLSNLYSSMEGPSPEIVP